MSKKTDNFLKTILREEIEVAVKGDAAYGEVYVGVFGSIN